MTVKGKNKKFTRSRLNVKPVLHRPILDISGCKESEKTPAYEKLAEEKVKADSILSSIGEGLFVIDTAGHIIEMNRAAEQLLEKSKSSVAGRIFSDVFVLKNEKNHIIKTNVYPISTTISKKLRIFSTAYFVKDDESTVPLAVTSAPIILGKRLFGIVITFRDITKEKEVDKAKSNFVSIASHQLRTPLTGIRWLLETVLKKGHLNTWQMEFLNDALKSNNRMIGLVNNLLNLSRLDTGSIAIQPEDIELIKFINSIIRDYKIMAKEGNKKIELKTKIKRLHINCDPQLLTQIIANLLSNAIKYAHKNTVVSIAIKRANEFVEISVQDRGIGVSKEDQARLFTKFFRTEEAVRTSTAGSGLGLYIVKRILDAIGGKISFSSVPDKGSIVTFSLPIKGVKKKAGEKSIIGWRS